jgi:glycine cleavage system H protein
MDFLPTKGIEYLLVIGYLLMLVPFTWALLGRRPTRETVPVRVGARGRARGAWIPSVWFPLPEGLHFHPGHTWAVPEGAGVFRVGMDDFALRMLGRPEALDLPQPGTALEQGEPGWRLTVDGRAMPLLSPVRGEVIEVNPEAVRSPGGVGEDAYGDGWLLKVRADRAGGVLKNLLSGELARAWMDQSMDRVSHRLLPQLGAVLQDGGEPVEGFARQLDPEHWPAIAAEMLLTAEPDEGDSASSGA